MPRVTTLLVAALAAAPAIARVPVHAATSVPAPPLVAFSDSTVLGAESQTLAELQREKVDSFSHFAEPTKLMFIASPDFTV